MEIDILSPQMRMRSVSTKRARSPDSPTPRERASKRPLIISHETMPQLSWNSGVASGFGGMGTRRHMHEDEWVHQTRDLTLHSPLVENGQHITQIGDSGLAYWTHEDVQMDAPNQTTLPDSTSQTLAHDYNTPPPTSISVSDNEELTALETSTPRHLQHRPYQISQPSPVRPAGKQHSMQPFLQARSCSTAPHIMLQPATPSSASESARPSPFMLMSPALSTPVSDIPSSPTYMTTEAYPSSPLSSSSLKSTGQKKRHLVSMGPRADCEKCRLKVPGHWMHFD